MLRSRLVSLYYIKEHKRSLQKMFSVLTRTQLIANGNSREGRCLFSRLAEITISPGKLFLYELVLGLEYYLVLPISAHVWFSRKTKRSKTDLEKDQYLNSTKRPIRTLNNEDTGHLQLIQTEVETLAIDNNT